jgi:hypothetical protein
MCENIFQSSKKCYVKNCAKTNKAHKQSISGGGGQHYPRPIFNYSCDQCEYQATQQGHMKQHNQPIHVQM